jgi:hypothetical protein
MRFAFRLCKHFDCSSTLPLAELDQATTATRGPLTGSCAALFLVRTMNDSGCASLFDRLPAGGSDLEANGLDRLGASLHGLAFCSSKPGAHEAGDHVAIKRMGRTRSASVAPCGLLASSFSSSSVRRGCGLRRRFRMVVIHPLSAASYVGSIGRRGVGLLGHGDQVGLRPRPSGGNSGPVGSLSFVRSAGTSRGA